MEKKTRKSVLPYYGVAAVWVVYALAFDLYRPVHFLAAAVLSAGVFALLRSVCPDAAAEAPKAPEPEPQPEQSGGGGGGGCSAGFGALALFAFVPLVLSRRK